MPSSERCKSYLMRVRAEITAEGGCAVPRVAWAITLFVSLLAPICATADDFLPPVDQAELIERLYAAEQRIQMLEETQAPTYPTSLNDTTWSSFESRLSALESSKGEAEGKSGDDDGKPTLKINGRIHLDYWNYADDSPGIGFFEHPDATAANFGADPQDRIFFRRIRLNFQGDIFDSMLYRMQIDFNTPESGEMKDMYIGFKDLPVLGTLLIGNQKRPLGLDHLNSSRFNVFIERPLVVEAFNEDARRIGIASYNYTEDELYHWRYGVYALENLTRDGKVIGDSMQLSGNARLSSSPWYNECSDGREYFHWAVAGMVARPDGDVFPGDTNRNEGRFRTRGELRSDSRWIDTGRIAGARWYEILAAEAILNLGPLQVVGEYQTTWMQRDNVTAGTGPDLNFHGGYVYVAYMLTGEHVPYKRTSGTIDRVRPYENFYLFNTCDGVASGWGAWQIAMRYSYLDLTDADIQGGIENNATLGLVWYYTSHSSLQFNAVYGDINERSPVGGFSDGHFTALGARLRVNF